jgi:hypothetical protein
MNAIYNVIQTNSFQVFIFFSLTNNNSLWDRTPALFVRLCPICLVLNSIVGLFVELIRNFLFKRRTQF